ncbi:MAG: hypothetical protein LBM41_05750 [Ruminococcus sp.]|nr:hypothetical protein [Ruminococcus sp.]
MTHLTEIFDTFELQDFISIIRNNHFDYTEWRRDNLFPGMTLDEILDHAAEHERIHGAPKIRGPQTNM